MSTAGRPRNIAGARRTTPDPALTVDYADVLRQAVENERWRVLRAVEEAVQGVETHKPRNPAAAWTPPQDRTAERAKADVLKLLRKMMETNRD